MPKVTVIMPALNVVKFIKPCMDSVCEQTMSELEILFIDAGSTDGTLEVVSEYAQRDNRIRLIHSDKKSYGYQLNLGIAEATGEYIGVVETDDLIVRDMYEILYAKAINTDADYVKGSAEVFVDISNKIRVSIPVAPIFNDISFYDKVVVPREMPELFVKDVYLWTGIYKKSFIKQILLNESAGAAFQDSGFMFQTYCKAGKAMYLTDKFYLYRQDNTNASSYDRRGFGYFVDEYDYIEKFMFDLSKEWYEAYYKRMIDHCRRRFSVMAVSGEFWEEAFPAMEELRRRLQEAEDKGFLSEALLDEERWKKLQLFLESPRAIYDAYATFYKQKSEYISDMLKLIDGRETVIFGSGKFGRFIHALLEGKCSGVVVAYCDNNEKLWNTEVYGVRILKPDEAAKMYPEAVYVITSIRSAEEMKKQLGELGIMEERMGVYCMSLDLLLFQLKV